MTRIKKGTILILCGLLALLLIVSACSGGNSTTTSAPATTSTPTSSAVTFQTLSAAGQGVYSKSCASCHGANGQGGSGPALWGANATLGKSNGATLFNNNAQDLLNYISAKMPLTAPGSLTHEQYVDVMAYILLQGNQVSGSTTFDENQLGSITLK